MIAVGDAVSVLYNGDRSQRGTVRDIGVGFVTLDVANRTFPVAFEVDDVGPFVIRPMVEPIVSDDFAVDHIQEWVAAEWPTCDIDMLIDQVGAEMIEHHGFEDTPQMRDEVAAIVGEVIATIEAIG